MYKVMLVDDEEIVIEGLKKKIDWEGLQLEIAGVAQDGLEALKMIEETTPDILITDVIMPVMDGLKLIETIKAMGKNIKTIILSGHDEFSYAQKALKLGAAEYQLKPISVEELEELLERIITKINEERQEEQVKNKLKKDNIQNSEIVKRHIFTSILEGRADNPEKLTSMIHDINKDYLTNKIVVSVVELDDYSKLFTDTNNKERELTIFSMLNIASEIVESNNKGFSIILDEKRLAAITFYDNRWSTQQI
ncbi:MAG TPA: response regulator, partial [Anaerovoracaceae bacterium]|nr:response regulator [Anaerovoracaceae bacterium]